MVNLRKLANKFIASKRINEIGENKKDDSQIFQDDLIKLTDRPTFDELVQFWMDDNKADFPIDFVHKDEFFEKGRVVYESIRLDKYIKNIIIKNSLDCAGEVKINIKNGELEIIIYIASINLGIGTGGGVQDFSPKQCEKFGDVLAHELFHAQNNIDIINKVGIKEYEDIRNSSDFWNKLVFIIFDEYYACRKNAEQFQSFESVETVKKVEYIVQMIPGLVDQDKMLIYHLFYAIATISAFADVSSEKEKELLSNASRSKQIFKDVRCIFNKFYKDIPLSAGQYKDMSFRIKEIYDLYIKQEIYN